MEKYSVKVPSISSNLDLGDSRELEIKNVYIARDKGEKFYPAIYLGQAFVYLEEDGMHRLYFKTISGIRNLFRDNDFLILVHGFPRSIIHLRPLIGIVLSEKTGQDTLIVLHEREKIYEFSTLSKGLFSKRTCYSKEIVQGFAGDTLFAIAHMGEKPACKDVLIMGKTTGNFTYKEYRVLLPMNWNGQWFSYINLRDDKVDHYISLFNGDTVKAVLNKNMYGGNFLQRNTMIYYGLRNNVIVLRSDRELKAIDLKKKDIIWQKMFNTVIKSPVHNVFLDKVLAYDTHNVFVLDVKTGEIEFKKRFDQKISHAILSDEYMVVALGETIYVFQRMEGKYALYGRYALPGEVFVISIHGEDMLITYKMPGNIIKAMYVTLSNPIKLEFNDITLITNTAAELQVKHYKADVKLLETTSPWIRLVKHRDKIALADLGSPPGNYKVTLQVTIPERLPVITDLNVKVEGLEKAFKKIAIPNKPVYSPRGAYIPITVSTDTSIDELYIILTNPENKIYGSTPLITNIPRGEKTIPLYIAWAKSGKHNIEIHVVGWSRRNRIYQRFTAQLVIDRDIPPLYPRFYSETLYLWSPYDIEQAEIVARSRDTSVNIRQSLNTGWNEIEAIKGRQDELYIVLPTRVRCVMRRGKSWIEFLK